MKLTHSNVYIFYAEQSWRTAPPISEVRKDELARLRNTEPDEQATS